MVKYYDLIQIEAAIVDMKRRIELLTISILKNQEEIDILLALNETLVENIKELKRTKQTVMAHEFRKAKEDLKKTTTRLAFLRMDKLTYERAYKGHTGMLDILKKRHEDATKIIENKVIVGNFGKKDGR